MTVAASVGVSVLVGTTAGVLARQFRLPGGPMIAALLAVAALHMSVDGLHALDPTFRTAAQIAIGAVLGTSLARGPLLSLRSVAVPAIGTLLLLIATAMGLALGVHAVTGIDAPTALLSLAPGGAGDMAAAGLWFKGDVALIASIHVIRQLIIFIVLVAVFTRFLPPPEPAPSASGDRP